MKKWMICLFVLLFAGFAYLKLRGMIAQPYGLKPLISPDNLEIDVTKEKVYQGDLLLVNKDHPVPDGLNPDLDPMSLISGQGGTGR